MPASEQGCSHLSRQVFGKTPQSGSSQEAANQSKQRQDPNGHCSSCSTSGGPASQLCAPEDVSPVVAVGEAGLLAQPLLFGTPYRDTAPRKGEARV